MIGWLGGKTKLRPTIIACMPKHETYVEIFCGSATVFFGKSPEISKSEIINDVHCELVNLMKVLSGTYFDETIRQEFIGYVRNMPASRDVFEDWKHWEEDKLNSLTPAQRAFRFYYCVKKGFSSLPKGGYEASPFGSSRYNMSSDFDKITARFRATNAQIERLDFRELIDKYSNSRAKTFFFGDPPYVVADGTNYYEHVFTQQDHQDLKECCDKIHKNKNQLLLTYDDDQEILDLYKDKHYYIYKTDPIVYSAMISEERNEISKQELFVTNYSIEELFKKELRPRTIDEINLPNKNDNRIEFENHISLTRIK